MARTKPQTPPDNTVSALTGRSAGRGALVNAAIFAAVIYVFGTQLRGLADSWNALRHADPLLEGLALLAVIASFGVAALTYYSLAAPTVRYLPTLAVQTASGFINRLLPGGLGSLGLFAVYLRRRGLSLAAASAVVAANNILGFVGNALLVLAVLATQPELLSQLRSPRISRVLLILILIVALLAGLAYVFRQKLGGRLRQYIRTTATSLGRSLQPGRRTLQALACNMLLTSLNAFTLSVSVAAVGGSLGWPAALLVLSIGTLIGSAIPTPGGIGGVEAGLLAGMLAFGTGPGIGLAAVLLYRGLTYWLPIIPGLAVFRMVQRKYLS